MQKRSVVWSFDRDHLETIIARSQSIAQVLDELGIPGACFYRPLWRRIAAEGISCGHIKRGMGSNSHARNPAIDLASVLVEGSTYHRGQLKQRLIAAGMLRNECYECGQLPEWMGEPLCLILDHINGVNNDNRFENLRLLCPNCDAQQATFTGNNWRHPNKPDAEELRRRASEAPLRDLASCYGVQIGTVSKWLKEYGIEKPPRGHWSRKGTASNRSREARKRQRKVEPPTADELAKLLWEIPSSKIAERYGLSDTMICKWAKSFGLSKPPRGYWSGRKG